MRQKVSMKSWEELKLHSFQTFVVWFGPRGRVGAAAVGRPPTYPAKLGGAVV